MASMFGDRIGNLRSTPSPKEILRTVKVSFTPPPSRAMQTPSNAWMRSRSPSLILTMTRRVSPGWKFGISRTASRRAFSSASMV
jgi:hypothetical protein